MITTDVEKLLAKLTENEKQLLKDTINEGKFGDDECKFYDEDDEIDDFACYGFCTNDAKKAKHFEKKSIPSMFRSIYSKLCDKYGIGTFLSHISDAWGDGTGDMLYIKTGYYDVFIEWARN